MSFSFRGLFSTLYLSVILEANQCLFYGKVMRGGKVVKSIEAKFDNDDEESTQEKINQYIKRQQKEYKWVYISLFFDSPKQGGVACEDGSDLRKFGIEPKSSGILKLEQNLLIYADLLEISRARDKFKVADVDMLYSPLVLLYYSILNKGLSDKNTLYIYNHKDSFALFITTARKFRFGAFTKTGDNLAVLSDEVSGFKKESIDEIDDFIAEVDSNIESMQNLESLDSLIGDSDEGFADLDYDIHMPTSSDVATSVSIFGRDMSVFRYISSTLKEFYSNPLYKSDFIESVVIFDNAKVSGTFLQYLQTELVVETAVYPVNTLKLMNEIMIDEVRL